MEQYKHRKNPILSSQKHLPDCGSLFLEDGASKGKMASEGIRMLFETGEIIYGYQACEITGTAYIDDDGKNRNKISNISNGDTATFRYIENRDGFVEAVLKTEGRGMITILLDDFVVGTVKVAKDGIHKIPLATNVVGSLQELKLVFSNVKALKMISFVLY